MEKGKFREIFETISPLLIKPTFSSITISLSRRFFLFTLLKKIVNIVEDDPHLNFIALLKSYKILGKILTGTVREFYRDRNKIYFKNFFFDKTLHQIVKEDLEWLFPKYKDLKMTITKRGVIIYDNYKKNSFNVLLMTIHSGTWVPEIIDKRMHVSREIRTKEEDIDTHKIYSNLILEKGGIWIDNKQSRFVCDFNRNIRKAIYYDHSEDWLNVVWKEFLSQKELDEILASYNEFYFTLSRLVESYHFNIIFDGHSMRHKPGRPNLSFGTKYIPKFYLPIVIHMQEKLRQLGYSHVEMNKPYVGGYILKWLRTQFPHLFILSMEVNKRIYMTDDIQKSHIGKVKSLSRDIPKIFDIEVQIDGVNKSSKEQSKK